LTTLDLKTGSRLDTLPLPEIKTKLINQQTDRIYLATDNGVIQCLHEIGLEKPVLHIPPPLEKKGAKETKQKGMDDAAEAEEGDEDAPKDKKKPVAKKPADDADDDDGMKDDAMKDDNPFGAGDDE
jgi:hypothetical protein